MRQKRATLLTLGYLRPYLRRNKINKLIIIFLAIYSFPAISNQDRGWPGEGVPVISFKNTSYVFCETPKTDSSCKSKNVKKGIQMTLDDYNQKYIRNSKYITTKPVIMTANKDFMIHEEKISIKKGMQIIKHQYAAEGYYTVEINKKHLQIALYDYKEHLENSEKEPETEWWVEIINKGWLKLTESNVIYHAREF